jgi:hypothetical protein
MQGFVSVRLAETMLRAHAADLVGKEVDARDDVRLNIRALNGGGALHAQQHRLCHARRSVCLQADAHVQARDQ